MLPAIIFYAQDPAATRRFYEIFGFTFVEEQHDDGPVHYACELSVFVFEIYPLRSGAAVTACDSFGMILPVNDFGAKLSCVKAMGLKPGKISIGQRGLRSVSVRDPDGRKVRLCERDPHVMQ